MLSPTTGLLRGLRAASLGVAGFVLALVAHLAAGGVAPGSAVLLLLGGLIAVAAVLITGVRLSPIRIGLSLSAEQVVLHEVFMRLGARADCLMTGAGAPAGGHLGHGQQMLGCATNMAHAGMGQTSMLATPAMVGAHAGATAAMVALLAYGEKLLWLLLAGYVRPPRWLRTGCPELLTVRTISAGASRMLRVRFAYGGVGRRGPPPRSLYAIV
jgi:hypothetical protein